ncbi:MAG: RagB/SusD family nutrient uptake outer membrane protein [Bacteroidales bacterium]|nr:RagB/SusD family nutrient uptake outer membrane protein [Bacteroidales bacterium]
MKLNKIFTYAVAGVATLAVSSCSDYLDKEVDLTLQADVVFADYDLTRGHQANAYTYLPDAFEGYNDTQYRLSNDCMTDNAVDYWGVARYHAINADSYDATNHWFAEHYWDNRTAGIRHCNQFLKNARADVVGNAEKSGDDNCLYDRWCAEVRAIRALLHFDMICWFGDCPIIGDDEDGTPIILEPSSVLPERTPAADALQWVIDECDAIKDKLPFRYSNEAENWGRVNGAAVYALKSRAALYRASALFNSSNDATRWSTAAQAALDFISKNSANSNPYVLYTVKTNNDPYGELGNYYECFATDPVYNNEFILSRSVWTTLQLEYFNAPCGFTGSISATGYCNPTQNLVDAYETADGVAIDKASNYDEQNPYVNRDPRLKQTIFHHGMTWGDTDEARELDMNNDDTRVGADYARGNGGTATGYYCKKYVYNIRWDGTISSQKHACPIFRYAEILLNAAEALNEAGRTSEAFQYVNQVRARAGMPPYSGLSQSELRERVRNERRIELCFEDHRYFDVRRWQLHAANGSATAETSLPRYQQVYNLYGVEIREGVDPSAPFVYGASRVDPRVAFTAPKNYFFPIMYDEVVKTGYTQTPGW